MQKSATARSQQASHSAVHSTDLFTGSVCSWCKQDRGHSSLCHSGSGTALLPTSNMDVDGS